MILKNRGPLPYGFICNGSAGFTLLEMIAVLVVSAILILVVTSAASRSNVNLNVRAESLKAHIRYAQAMAMRTDDQNWGIRFDRSSSSYWLFYSDSGLTDENRIPFPGAESDRQNLLNAGIKIIRIDFGDIYSGDIVTLAFDNFGTPHWGEQDEVLEEDLASIFEIELQEGGRSETIEVFPTTGFVP